MAAPYSYDFRKKAIDAYKRGERKIHICRLLNISRNTLDLWLKKETETGDFRAETNCPKGPLPKINDEKKFREFVKKNGSKTQKEMARLWGEGVTQQNISDALIKWRITRKKKTYGYRERDEEKRQDFLEILAKIEEGKRVYVDEAGMDNREDYPYGYCERGERFYALRSGKRTERISWIAALKNQKIFAPLRFRGGCNKDLFEAWVEYCLIPQLEAGDVVIIDNASFHKSTVIRELIEEAECSVLFLPTYSPDFNKIERWWFVLKNWMKQRIHEFENLEDCIDAAFRECPNVFA